MAIFYKTHIEFDGDEFVDGKMIRVSFAATTRFSKASPWQNFNVMRKNNLMEQIEEIEKETKWLVEDKNSFIDLNTAKRIMGKWIDDLIAKLNLTIIGRQHQLTHATFVEDTRDKIDFKIVIKEDGLDEEQVYSVQLKTTWVPPMRWEHFNKELINHPSISLLVINMHMKTMTFFSHITKERYDFELQDIKLY